MTERELYVVHDVVAGESGPIFEANNDGVALRQYQHMMAKEGVQEGDFLLINLGSVDHTLNKVVALKAPRRVVASLEMALDTDEGIV